MKKLIAFVLGVLFAACLIWAMSQKPFQRAILHDPQDIREDYKELRTPSWLYYKFR